jgi:type I restriction enzyme R subunit
MIHQSEQTLENKLIQQLEGLEYERIDIYDEAGLLKNLKIQLEMHNGTVFSDKEFDKILNHLNKGSIFERAKTLRNRMRLARDNGQNIYIRFINMDDWCQNEFQVTNQVEIE